MEMKQESSLEFLISGFKESSGKELVDALYKAAEKADLYVEEGYLDNLYAKVRRLTFFTTWKYFRVGRFHIDLNDERKYTSLVAYSELFSKREKTDKAVNSLYEGLNAVLNENLVGK